MAEILTFRARGARPSVDALAAVRIVVGGYAVAVVLARSSVAVVRICASANQQHTHVTLNRLFVLRSGRRHDRTQENDDR